MKADQVAGQQVSDGGMTQILTVCTRVLNPMAVAMDSRGNSMYEDIRTKPVKMIDTHYKAFAL